MFFGIIHQAAGSNDHPSAPIFLQLYKILSSYSILKPPKSGNCTVDDDSPLTPVITISDLKDIYYPEKSHLVENLKNKLNKIKYLSIIATTVFRSIVNPRFAL
jgi:hypothetical protein|uniref:Uncharacterized protein n=1 Tax=Sipha flava TaxID=143950 RepID=A0A2S2QK40_9HEMI